MLSFRIGPEYIKFLDSIARHGVITRVIALPR